MVINTLIRPTDQHPETIESEQERRSRGLDSFVGVATSHDAPPDLQTHRKQYVGEIIGAKYPQHGHR